MRLGDKSKLRRGFENGSRLEHLTLELAEESATDEIGRRGPQTAATRNHPRFVGAPKLLHCRGAKAMRTNDRLVGSRSRRSFEQFHETRLVRITQRTLAIWLDPLGMLDPEVVVNLLPKLGVSVGLVRRSHWFGERFTYDAGLFI